MNNATNRARPLRVPPPQNNLETALCRAFDAIQSQTDEQIRWLGGERAAGAIQLPVLDDTLRVDLGARCISTSSGRRVGSHWGILVLHYLAKDSRPETRPPETTFAELATARTYAGVYHGRVIARLCATAGRDAGRLSAAAGRLGGIPVETGDRGFDFAVFPRLRVRLIWHAPDEEFPPSATLLLPANVESYLCAEDIVVLSELLVARLGGRPF